MFIISERFCLTRGKFTSVFVRLELILSMKCSFYVTPLIKIEFKKMKKSVLLIMLLFIIF